MLANKLKIGDTIGVIAPDKALKNKDIKYLENATKYFEILGLKVKYGKYLFSEDNYLMGIKKLIHMEKENFMNLIKKKLKVKYMELMLDVY